MDANQLFNKIEELLNKKCECEKMLELLTWGSCLILGGYGFWFFFKVKTLQPLALDNIKNVVGKLTWKNTLNLILHSFVWSYMIYGNIIEYLLLLYKLWSVSV